MAGSGPVPGTLGLVGSAGALQKVQNLFSLGPLAGAARLLRGLGALGGFSAFLRWVKPLDEKPTSQAVAETVHKRYGVRTKPPARQTLRVRPLGLLVCERACALLRLVL